MAEFVQALLNPDVPFLRLALVAGLMGSVAFGMIGSFVVVRRIGYIAGAISHSTLAGIGAGLFARRVLGISWLDPLFSAVVVAVLSALLIGLVSLRFKEREDTAIGALWSIGMAVGLLFINATPGYADPMSYLFGNILLIKTSDVLLIAALDLLIVLVVLVYYNKLLAVCFDDEFAAVRGLRVDLLYLGLLALTALTVVLMVRLVGIVLVIALLTLPAAAAGQFTTRLRSMMFLATGICAVSVTSGLTLSYILDAPTGPMIIIVAALLYGCGLCLKKLFSR